MGEKSGSRFGMAICARRGIFDARLYDAIAVFVARAKKRAAASECHLCDTGCSICIAVLDFTEGAAAVPGSLHIYVTDVAFW